MKKSIGLMVVVAALGVMAFAVMASAVTVTVEVGAVPINAGF